VEISTIFLWLIKVSGHPENLFSQAQLLWVVENIIGSSIISVEVHKIFSSRAQFFGQAHNSSGESDNLLKTRSFIWEARTFFWEGHKVFCTHTQYYGRAQFFGKAHNALEGA
jgi:hypothetical protein